MWLHHGKDCLVLCQFIVSVFFVVISGPTNICKNPHIGHQYNVYWYIGTPLMCVCMHVPIYTLKGLSECTQVVCIVTRTYFSQLNFLCQHLLILFSLSSQLFSSLLTHNQYKDTKYH